MPFWIMPGSWGLSGNVYEEAKAYYYYSGEMLDRQLAEIKHKDDMRALKLAMLDIDLKYNKISQYEHDKKTILIKYENDQKIVDTKLLSLDLKYNKINEYEYDIRLLEINGYTDERSKAEVELKHKKISEYDFDLKVLELTQEKDTKEYEHLLLQIKFKHGKIDKLAFDKQSNTLDEKPWIGIIDQGFDETQGVNGVYFEFDWNIQWIDYLRMNGYTGNSEEEIVERWFQDVCKATAATVMPEEIDNNVFPIAGRMPSRKNGRFQREDGPYRS